MPIYVYSNNEQSGPFEENHIIEQLRSGGLSINDMGVAVGGTEWKPLGVLFSDALGTSDAKVHSVPVSSGVTAKNGGGFRKIFGTILLIGGILLTLGGFGLAIFNRIMPDHRLCQEADKVMLDVKQLTADREAAKGTPAETEIARKQIERTTRMGSINKACGEMESYYLWWFVAFLVIGAIGLALSLAGFFVRRVQST